MKIALVTGASSGLGREFVRQIAEQRTSGRAALMGDILRYGIV